MTNKQNKQNIKGCSCSNGQQRVGLCGCCLNILHQIFSDEDFLTKILLNFCVLNINKSFKAFRNNIKTKYLSKHNLKVLDNLNLSSTNFSQSFSTDMGNLNILQSFFEEVVYVLAQYVINIETLISSFCICLIHSNILVLMAVLAHLNNCFRRSLRSFQPLIPITTSKDFFLSSSLYDRVSSRNEQLVQDCPDNGKIIFI